MNSDDSVVVQAVECETLARTGDNKQRAAAFKRLGEIATDAKASFFERHLALESIAACNPKIAEIPPGLNAIEKVKFDVANRYEKYPERAVKSIQLLSENESLQTPIP
jgi:hypothetical protein